MWLKWQMLYLNVHISEANFLWPWKVFKAILGFYCQLLQIFQSEGFQKSRQLSWRKEILLQNNFIDILQTENMIWQLFYIDFLMGFNLISFNSIDSLKVFDWITTLEIFVMNKDEIDRGNNTGVSTNEPSPSPWQRTSSLSQSQNEKLQMSEDPLAMSEIKISKGGLKPVLIVFTTNLQVTLLSCLAPVSYYSSPTHHNIHTWGENTAFPPSSPVTGRHIQQA